MCSDVPSFCVKPCPTCAVALFFAQSLNLTPEFGQASPCCNLMHVLCKPPQDQVD